MPEQAHGGGEWAEILSGMERELEAVQRDPAAGTGTMWTAPVAAGPIPAELADRALSLVAAQQDAAAALQQELAATARHLSALRSIPAAVASGGAVYLDVTG